MRSLYNLSLGKKLAIIVIGLLLPSAWLLLKLVSQQEVTIATAELKLQGLEYMHRIWRLSGPLADHRSMGLRYASGKPEDLEIAHNKVAEVDAAIKSVDEYENLVDERLRNGAEWRDVMKRWRVLRDRKSELNAAQYFAGHSEVLDTLATFNQRLANRSTLLYEAEETTHFLVDVVVRDIPQVQNGIFSLRRAVVVGSGTANVMNPQRADLAARVHVVSVDAKSLRTNVEQLAAALPESATRLRAAVDAYKSVAEQYAKTVEDNMVMADNRAPILNTAGAEAAAAFAASSELQESLLKPLKTELEERREAAIWTRNATLAGFLLLLIAVLSLERMLRRQISKSARTVVDTMKRMANGEIGQSMTVTGTDELGQALVAVNRLDLKLADVVAVIRNTANTVGSAARELSFGNEELSSRTQSQASALEQTASSMEQMTATVKQNAHNAGQANQLAAGVRDQAELGQSVVHRAIEAMNEINSASTKIAAIIGVIDEIAFQTNLLALNAAVEAARAGEQGSGFAVVAGEVRTLAKRSAEAAKDIKKLIKDSVDKVKVGAELVNESGKTLAEILVSVRRVTDIVAEIADASSEQSAGIDQVNGAVTQMDAMTQENAARVDQASVASKAMQQHAEELVKQISYFRLNSQTKNPIAA